MVCVGAASALRQSISLFSREEVVLPLSNLLNGSREGPAPVPGIARPRCAEMPGVAMGDLKALAKRPQRHCDGGVNVMAAGIYSACKFPSWS